MPGELRILRLRQKLRAFRHESIRTRGPASTGRDVGRTAINLLTVTLTPRVRQLISLCTCSAFIACGAVTIASAQTAFEIAAKEPNLETQYRDELDKWMLRAYEGDRDAQFKVGVLFTNDQFDRADYEQAVYWYKQAARQGHVMAQYNLGHQYLTGVGVEKNERLAMQWWLEAAKLDHALAQFNVGRAYYLGIGMNEDHAQSKYWFDRAAQNQEPKSIEILKQLGWYEGQPPTNTAEKAERSVVSTTSVPDSGTESLLASRITPVAENPAFADAQTAESLSSAASGERDETVSTIETQMVLKENQTADGSQSNNASDAPKPALHTTPVALYTNPAVRSVLITIVDDRDSLTVTKAGADWSTVQSATGFPVWIHGDFLQLKNDQGVITGQAVNARSVPIITSGTVVGKFNKGEKVVVLDKRKSWYRVTAPKRFTAWVKTDDFKRSDKAIVNNTDGAASQDYSPPPQQVAAAQDATAGIKSVNDNSWLFNQPSDSYTLQLASFDDPQKVREFLSRHKFTNNPKLHRFTARGKDIEWTYFLYGAYSQKEDAEAAKQEIKQKLAWVRTFGRLQQNRCVAWKTQLPTPAELNKYCAL